jgi:hypothetical protein
MSDSDHQIEEMLKHYRPRGPSPGLRQRVLGGRTASSKQSAVTWSLRIAAAILVVAGLGVVLRLQNRRGPMALEESPLDRIQSTVARAGEAAQLLAAADVLAQQPGGKTMARETYAHIASLYSGSPPALEAKSRLSSLDERSVQP